MSDTPRSEAELVRVVVDDRAFHYFRTAKRVFFWPETSNFDPPEIPVSLIAKATTVIRAKTKAPHRWLEIQFTAAPPGWIDGRFERLIAEGTARPPWSSGVPEFNDALKEAAIRLGVDRGLIDDAFGHVGMPGEWRGALARFAHDLETVEGTETSEARKTAAAVCRFVAESMREDGLFPWTIATGTAILKRTGK
jgi:hypothetical protein